MFTELGRIVFYHAISLSLVLNFSEYKLYVWDPVHTSPERVENSAKRKTPLRSHGTGSKLCHNVTSTGAIWKRFLNGARWKRNQIGGVMWTQNPVLFHSALMPYLPLSQNSNLNCFLCYFLCSIWKVWGLSELLCEVPYNSRNDVTYIDYRS